MEEAGRIAQRLRTDHSRAAISRVLAERVAKGQNITEAVFATMDELKAASGTICPIKDVPDVPTNEVSIEGEVITLWRPSSRAISQVGLIADDTGKIQVHLLGEEQTKVHARRRSGQDQIREEELVSRPV